MLPSYAITAFYRFFPVENVQTLRDALDEKGQKLALIGLILVAEEGINGTIAGSAESIEQFKKYLREFNQYLQ